jgi:2-dehydropantoate 2-reductase
MLSPWLGDHVFRPAQVLRAAVDYQGGPPDYLILSVKVIEGTDRVRLIHDAIGPNTVIVVIENGVDIDQEIADAFPSNELISALAYIAVSRVGRGAVKHHAYGNLVIGNYPRGTSEMTQRLANLFLRGKVKCSLTEDIATARWQKCVWNAVFNPISVLGGGLDTQTILTSAGGEAFVRQALQEVCLVAAANGHPLPDNVVDQNIRGTRKMPAHKTSMLLDFEGGHPMEVEAIVGNTVRAGRGKLIPMPALEALYALLKMVQARQAMVSPR